jgi:excinuclease ABC subunit B
MNKPQMEKVIQATKKKMEKAARELDFLEAARLRDEMFALEKLMKERFSDLVS